MALSWRRVGVVAKREWRTTVRRREFLFMTFGLPLVYLCIGLVVAFATASAVGRAVRRESDKSLPRVVGFFDASRSLAPAALSAGDDDLKGRVFPSVAAGQEAVRKGDVRAFVSVPADFAKSGDITVYLPPGRESAFVPAGLGGVSNAAITRLLRRAILSGRTDPATVDLALRWVDGERLNWDPKTGRFARPDPVRSIARLAVPYAFSLLLLLSVMFSSSYLVHGIVDEKENRVMEVLLSASTHEELLTGKLLGLGGAGLTQLGIWLVSGALLGGLARSVVRLPPGVSLSGISIGPGLILTAILMFLGGYALYGALMVGIGSFGSSWRESQQVTGMLASILTAPLVLLPVILEEPDGAVSRWFSLIPLTAPVGMILRVSAGGASAGEVALSALLVALTTAGAILLSARLFRLSLLLYGQRPSLGIIWRTLRGAR